MEKLLFLLLTKIIPFIQVGDILDAGANDGSSAIMMSTFNRSILCLEPLPANVKHIKQNIIPFYSNIQILEGLLDSENNNKNITDKLKKVGQQVGLLYDTLGGKTMQGKLSVKTYTIDYLFRYRRLSFAHIDVEGGELNVLLGAQKTIERDQPIFTVETHIKKLPHMHSRLFEFVYNKMGYECLTIKENCGFPQSWMCRNHICFPPQMKTWKEQFVTDNIEHMSQ